MAAFGDFGYLPDEARAGIQHTNQSPIKIVSTRFTAHKVEIVLAAQKPGLVLIPLSYYLLWRACADGQSTRLRRADYAFQAPSSGRTTVTVVYENYQWYWDIAVSSLALCACLAAWF